jgi:hypothetical protein
MKTETGTIVRRRGVAWILGDDGRTYAVSPKDSRIRLQRAWRVRFVAVPSPCGMAGSAVDVRRLDE